jgi:2-hydroxy-3-oxopropionate reductase
MMKTLGFVGLGLMGKPMAQNLMKGGYELVVHDVNRAPVKELVAAGAKEGFSAKQVAGAAEVLITSLPEDQVVEEVILGKEGLLEGMKKGSVLVETSTISPLTARRVAARLNEKGVEMLDAPLSGGEVGAKQATLSIMVGGKAEVLQRVLPALQKMGKNIAKAANQIIVALTIEAVAEALIFAKKAGADPAKVRQAMLGGFAQSRILDEHGQRMLDRNFKPGGRAVTHQKDIGIVLSVAREKGIYLPGTMMVMDFWNAMGAHGLLQEDHTAMLKVLEKMSNTEVMPG